MKFRLNRIQNEAISKTSTNTTSKDEYASIIQSGISEDFSDASLCLKQIWLRHTSIYPDDLSNEETNAIYSSGKECLFLLKRVVSGLSGHRTLKKGGICPGYFDSVNFADFLKKRREAPLTISKIMIKFLRDLNLAFSRNTNKESRIDLKDASRIFLSAAVRIENLLLRLKEEDQEVSDLGQDIAGMVI